MANVLTIGEAMGLLVADELKPLEDVCHFSRYICGAEVNFSIGMARLGHDISYITCVGRDPFGKAVQKFLQQNNVDCRYLSFDDNHQTGMQLKEKVIKGDPEVVNFRKNTAFSNINPDIIDDIDLKNIKHLHITGIPLAVSLNSRKTVYKLVEKARKMRIQISFDTNLRPKLWKNEDEMREVTNDMAKFADIILPGLKEGEFLTGKITSEEIADFYMKIGVKTVIIKEGSKGAFAKNKDEKFFIPAFDVKNVIDTVGAGDGFAVGVVSAILEGLNLKDAVIRGNAIGALAIQVAGDNEGLPTKEQLLKFLQQN